MKKSLILLILMLIIFTNTNCQKQNKNDSEKNFEIYIANWNVENLFDTVDDEDKNDEWFLPSSEINWDEEKLDQKLKNQAKVIEFMNDGNGPDILGIEEVEHESLLKRLLNNLKLNKNYKIAYKESPDSRGIDNAIIYNSDKLKFVSSEGINVTLDQNKTTRDILKAEFKVNDENLVVFCNHWPSRREGLKESEKNRIRAAEALKNEIDEIKDSYIVILGDFNDLPSNISITKILSAKEINCNKEGNKSKNELYNLSTFLFKKGEGSYKYRDHWNMLDQIIISDNFIGNSGIEYICNSFEIIKPNLIIQKNGKYAGTPLPTFGGKKYLGGYSDHFPVGAKFKIQN